MYRKDPDLEFLQFCDNEDLEILVNYLTKDKNDGTRLTQELTSDALFKKCHENYKQVWDLIAGELQCFGADSFATLLRGGKGVVYREILIDVCKHLKVNVDKKLEISKIEEALLLRILRMILEKMTEEEKKELFMEVFKKMTEKQKQEFFKMINFNGERLDDFEANPERFEDFEFNAEMYEEFFKYFNFNDFFNFMASIMGRFFFVIIANSVATALIGRSLILAAEGFAVTRSLAIFAGPIGWVISGLFTLPMISGPAYRVTVPSIIQISYMRQKYKNKTN